jgi:hypothetical protein
MDAISAVSFVFVLVLTINGEDFTHSERMATQAACEKEAHVALKDGAAAPNDGPGVRIIKSGCFAYIEPTPAH